MDRLQNSQSSLMPLLSRQLEFRWLLAAACVWAAFGLGSQARGQAPFFGLDWFRTAYVTDWLSRYWDEEEAEDGTRLARVPVWNICSAAASSS